MDYKLTIFIIIMFFLAGCKSARNVPERTAQQFPGNEKFTLVVFNNQKIDTPDGHKQVSVRFSKEVNQISGYAGCNRFFGSYEIKSDSLSFGVMASTRMACTDMQIEDRLLTSLNNNRFRFQLNQDTLVLVNHKDTLIFLISESDPHQ